MIASSLPVFANPRRQWLVGLGSAAAVFLFMWAYHDWWRAKPYTLATANEAISLAAYACIGICLAMAPVQRLLGLPEAWAGRRRPFALAGAGAAGIHAILSLAATPGLSWLWKHPLSASLAAAATVLVAALAITSFPSTAARLGPAWRRLHLLAVPAFVLITMHVLVLGKSAKWLSWWQARDLPMPPGTLAMAVLGALVLAIRSLDAVSQPGRRLQRLASDGVGLLLIVGTIIWTARPVPPPAAAAMPPPAVETVILCGSSMRAPIEAVVALARSKGLAVRVDYGGSETILPRLLAGERADVAVLHDPFPGKLAAAGLLAARLDVGGLEPMLVTAPGNPFGLRSLADLARPGLRVGLPDARYSTCGEYLLSRLRADGLAEGVAARVVVEQRQHAELVTAVRVGAIDAAVVWNFVALPARPAVAATPLSGPWPVTTVAVCTLRGGDAAAGQLTAAVGGEGEIARIFALCGFAHAVSDGSAPAAPR